jgi:CDP-glucose 4,6-dehydratase
VSFGGFYQGKRVFVTGSTGFKGSWLCHWLQMLGATVGGYALPPITVPNAWTALHLNQKVQQRMADVRDLGMLRESISQFKPQVVFHLAAQPLVRDSYADPKGTFDINVGGTVNVLEAIRGLPGVQSCVVVTTDKCYENREWIWGYRETDALGGHDPYSASKAAAEVVVASYRRSFFASTTTHLASARAGNVIGGGDWSKDRLVVDFIRAISAGAPLRLRNPHATRPWQHVLEPLSGYLQLAWRLCGASGGDFAEAWNFGPDERSVVTVETLAGSLVRHWGSGRVEIQAGEHPHEAGLLKLDVSKARTRLGWQGIWDIDRTIQQTVDWYRAFDAGKDPQALCERQINDYVHDAGLAHQPWARRQEAAT